MSRPARVPGAVPAAADADDLTGLEEGGALPPSDPVMVELASLRAQVTRLSRRDAAAPQKAAERAIDAKTQDEARAMAEESVKAGVRPRALLTPDGWYVHPEMSRGPGSLGNKATA